MNNSCSTFSKIPKKVRYQLKPLVEKLLKKCTNVKSLSKKIDWNELKEFFELLLSIRELEKPYAPVLTQRENHWDTFYAWCSQHGAKFNDVTFEEICEGNFGAVAQQDINENEPFLSVPRKIMMSELSAKSSKLGSLISSDPILRYMPNVQITMHLIMEFLNPDSQWMPYISILPSNFNTILYFTLDEIKQLQGSPVLDEVIKMLYSVARQYCYFSLLFQTNHYARSLNIGHYFTYELYRWAVSVVMTRQNCIPSPDGTENITALVPLFDMCNHANGKLLTDFSLEKEMLISYSCKSFKKKDEVCTFYGNRTNGEFFVHNAFVYPENENDAVEIKIGLGKSDPLLNLKQAVCNKLEVPMNGPFFIRKGGIISPELLKFLEINVMKSDELIFLHEKTEEFPSEKYSDIKTRAVTFLKDRIFLLLQYYQTTLEKDGVLKATVPETQNLHLIIQLRMCEKKILDDAYKFCVESTS